MTSYSDVVKDALSPLLLLPGLLNIDDWKKYLPEPATKTAWTELGTAVSTCFWHQSEEATDCRWVKVLCRILGDKLKFTSKMEDTVRGILQYPNFGDLRHIRPSIRSTEIADSHIDKKVANDWANYFWQYCFDHTSCTPEEALNKKMAERRKQFIKEMDLNRKHYFDITTKIRNELIDHYFKSSESSSTDTRHEGSFGLALYALSILIELNFYKATLSIIGRHGLRALVETYITFAYLLKKDVGEKTIWNDYRAFGTGQIKLIYLKYREQKISASSVFLDDLDRIANEDKWIEFTPIQLGNWDSTNLRQMSIDTGLKHIYDKFYDYTSGFTHGSWGAVRESVYQRCINPLHKYHRIPTFDLPLMPSVMEDAREMTNEILNCLSVAYPEFKSRISPPLSKVLSDTKSKNKKCTASNTAYAVRPRDW